MVNRKEAILDAAIQLFAEKGFTATPTSAIAKMAGVAEGLIFHYFKNKEGIFMHILDEMMGRYLEGIEANTKTASTGLEAIESAISFHLRFSEARSREILILIRDFPFDLMTRNSPARRMIADHSDRVSALLKKYIESGQRDGSIRDVSSRETALILRAVLNGLSRLKMLGTHLMPDLASEVVNFCRQGLARKD